MARVRARFKVGSVVQLADGAEYVSMYADTEHQEWAKYTPNGTLMMNITAEGAIGTFRSGQTYGRTFEPTKAD